MPCRTAPIRRGWTGLEPSRRGSIDRWLRAPRRAAWRIVCCCIQVLGSYDALPPRAIPRARPPGRVGRLASRVTHPGTNPAETRPPMTRVSSSSWPRFLSHHLAMLVPQRHRCPIRIHQQRSPHVHPLVTCDVLKQVDGGRRSPRSGDVGDWFSRHRHRPLGHPANSARIAQYASSIASARCVTVRCNDRERCRDDAGDSRDRHQARTDPSTGAMPGCPITMRWCRLDMMTTATTAKTKTATSGSHLRNSCSIGRHSSPA